MENDKKVIQNESVAPRDYERELVRQDAYISELRMEIRRNETVIATLSDKITELESRIKYSNNKY